MLAPTTCRPSAVRVRTRALHRPWYACITYYSECRLASATCTARCTRRIHITGRVCRRIPWKQTITKGYTPDQVETHYKSLRFRPDCLFGGAYSITQGCECEIDLPSWGCATIKPGEADQPTRELTTDGTVSVEPTNPQLTNETPQAGSGGLQLLINAGDPLYENSNVSRKTLNLLPNIDLDIGVSFTPTGPCKARVSFKGSHDPFPWYEIYVESPAEGVKQLHTYSGLETGPVGLGSFEVPVIGKEPLGAKQDVDVSTEVTTCVTV